MERVDEKGRLRLELSRLADTAETLSQRLERTLVALALTLEAEAVTRQQLASNGMGWNTDRMVSDLQLAAEQYRNLAAVLGGTPRRGDEDHP
jgi:hypothetical protein